MVESSNGGAARSNGRAFRCESETGTTFQSESDGSEWFASVAQTLLGKDAGFALHCLTGFPESSCYNYTAGRRKVPGYLIVALLRSPQGAQWLAAFMDGSDAPWWHERHRVEAIAQMYDRQRAEAKRLGLE